MQAARPAVPTFNRAHPMGRKGVLSWIAAGNSGGYNLARKHRGVLTGTPTQATTAYLGNTLTFASTNAITFTTGITGIENVCTFWALMTVTSIATQQDVLVTASNSTGWDLNVNASGAVVMESLGSSVQTSSGIVLTVNIPYLIIASVDWLAVNFLVKRLDTGVTTTATGVVAAPSTTNGIMKIGADPFTWALSTARFAAAGISYIGLPLAAMKTLANDPWGPWRPTPMRFEQMVAGGAAVFVKSFTDTPSITDGFVSLMTVAGATSDAPAITDALSPNMVAPSAWSDAPSIVEGLFARSVALLSDAPAITETLASAMVVPTTWADVPGIVDVFSANSMQALLWSDLRSPTDLYTSALAAVNALWSDTPLVTDAFVTTAGIYILSFSDTVSAPDSFPASMQSAASFTDAPSVADHYLAAMTGTLVLADLITPTDVTSSAMLAPSVWSDAPAIFDSVLSGMRGSALWADSPSITDIFVSLSAGTFNLSFADAPGVTEILTESMSASFGWSDDVTASFADGFFAQGGTISVGATEYQYFARRRVRR